MQIFSVENIVKYIGVVGGINYFGGIDFFRSMIAGTLGGCSTTALYHKFGSNGTIRFKDEFSGCLHSSAFSTAGFLIGRNVAIPYGQYLGMVAGSYFYNR